MSGEFKKVFNSLGNLVLVVLMMVAPTFSPTPFVKKKKNLELLNVIYSSKYNTLHPVLDWFFMERRE